MAPYRCGLQFCGTDTVDSAVDPPHFAEGSPVCTECTKEVLVPKFHDALNHEACYPAPWGDSGVLDVDDFEDVLGADFVRRYKRKEKWYAVPLADRRLCKHVISKDGNGEPDYCNEQLAPTTVATHGEDLRCPACNNVTCGKCEMPLKPWKPSRPFGHVCETVEEREVRIAKEKADKQEQLEKLTRGRDYQICPGPKCGMLYYLGEACNHMTCRLRSCRTEFCYNCGKKERSMNHWTAPGSGCQLYGYTEIEPHDDEEDAVELDDHAIDDLFDSDSDSDEDNFARDRRPIDDLETNNPNAPAVTEHNHPDIRLEQNDDNAALLAKVPREPEFAWIKLTGATDGLLRMHIDVFFSYVALYVAQLGHGARPQHWALQPPTAGLISFRLRFHARRRFWAVDFGREANADEALEYMSSAAERRRVIRLLDDEWMFIHLVNIIGFVQDQIDFTSRGTPPQGPNALLMHHISDQSMDVIEEQLSSWTLVPPSIFSGGAHRDVVVRFTDFMEMYYLLARWFNQPVPVALERREDWGEDKWLRISLTSNPETGVIRKARIIVLFERDRVRGATRGLVPHLERMIFGRDSQQDVLTWMMEYFRTDPLMLFPGRYHELPAGFHLRHIPGTRPA